MLERMRATQCSFAVWSHVSAHPTCRGDDGVACLGLECPLSNSDCMQISAVQLPSIMEWMSIFSYMENWLMISVIVARQVIYPLSVAEAVALEGEGSDELEAAAILDARLDALMGVVRLQYLIEREGGWGATAEWGEVLSLGAPDSSCWFWKPLVF